MSSTNIYSECFCPNHKRFARNFSKLGRVDWSPLFPPGPYAYGSQLESKKSKQMSVDIAGEFEIKLLKPTTQGGVSTLLSGDQKGIRYLSSLRCFV